MLYPSSVESCKNKRHKNYIASSCSSANSFSQLDSQYIYVFKNSYQFNIVDCRFFGYKFDDNNKLNGYKEFKWNQLINESNQTALGLFHFSKEFNVFLEVKHNTSLEELGVEMIDTHSDFKNTKQSIPIDDSKTVTSGLVDGLGIPLVTNDKNGKYIFTQFVQNVYITIEFKMFYETKPIETSKAKFSAQIYAQLIAFWKTSKTPVIHCITDLNGNFGWNIWYFNNYNLVQHNNISAYEAFDLIHFWLKNICNTNSEQNDFEKRIKNDAQIAHEHIKTRFAYLADKQSKHIEEVKIITFDNDDQDINDFDNDQENIEPEIVASEQQVIDNSIIFKFIRDHGSSYFN